MNAESKITKVCRSGLPRRQSTGALTDPKLKMSGRQRRSLMRSRDLILVRDETPEPTHANVKMAVKLHSLTMAQLNRRVHQFARRASTAKHIALKLPAGGKLRATMEQQQGIQLGFYKQAEAEINARRLAVAGRLADKS